MERMPYRETPQSRISGLAIKLLRRDYADRDSQMRAVRWAEDEFNRVGLWPVGNLTRETRPDNIVFNLIEENALPRGPPRPAASRRSIRTLGEQCAACAQPR
jgi:hypothetical protein